MPALLTALEPLVIVLSLVGLPTTGLFFATRSARLAATAARPENRKAS